MAEREDRGFQRIGSHVPSASNMRLIEDSTPQASEKSSSIGGLPPADRMRSNVIGMPRGERGVAALSLDQALTGKDPEATDRAILASLPPSVASALSRVEEAYIDPVYGFDTKFCGYMLVKPITPADREKAQAIVERALRSAELSVIRQALTLLRVGTKARDVGVDDLVLMMQVMADECAEFPPDVVQAACLRWARREKWFPALCELRDEMQRLVRHRELVAEALRH